jgi:shikimate kinase
MSEVRRVYLMGFMGSGKTTTGRKLATSLGWSFLDLDKEIEQKTCRTINDLFANFGEDYFRKIESETLRNLTSPDDIVIATGGGSPCYGNNLDFMLETGLTVYLRMTSGQLKSRLTGTSGERPLTKDKNEKQLSVFIREKLAEREKWYMQAKIVIDGKNLNVNHLKTLIINHFG